MSEQVYPPPPPPENPSAKEGVHGPETRFFVGVRRRLDALEQSFQLSMGRSPKTGLFVALILGATLSIVLSIVVQLATGLPTADWVLLVIVAPITEEPFKALSILLVVLFMWRTIPNRRWAAALGAATGMGFAIAETGVYAIGGAGAGALLARIIVEPFMHPLWSAFVAMGIFVLLARKPTREIVSSVLGILFLFMGLFAHMSWNGLSAGLAPSIGYGVLVVNLLLVFLPFSMVLRDLLGGHFNFQNFFEPVLEPSTFAPISPPPPPPPPPP